jgi:hypothetical protein
MTDILEAAAHEFLKTHAIAGRASSRRVRNLIERRTAEG